MSEDLFVTPIGMAFDLSSKDKVSRPILGDPEVEESATPLPALFLLTQEGILCGWWFVYNDAVRAKQPYPEATSVLGQPTSSTQPTQPPASQPSPFGVSSQQSVQPGGFASFGKPNPPGFGTSPFGQQTSSGAGFGGASAFGAKTSPWASGGNTTAPQTAGVAFGQTGFGAGSTGSAFGKPAFGSTSKIGQSSTPSASAFGAVGAGLGAKPSVWGAPSTTGQQPSEPKPNPFGSNTAASSPFSAFGNNNSKPSGFAGLAGSNAGNAFSGLGQSSKPAFGQPAPATASPETSFGMKSMPSFGSTVTVDSTAGGSTLNNKSLFNTPSQPSDVSIFGTPKAPTPPTQESEMGDADAQDAANGATAADKPFGFGIGGAGGFKLGSTFTPANQEGKEGKDDTITGKLQAGEGMFGSDFGKALSEAKDVPETPIKKEPGTNDSRLGEISTTPASPPKNNPLSLHGGFTDVGNPAPFFPPTQPAEPSKPTEVNETPLPEGVNAAKTPESPGTARSEESDSGKSAPLAGSPPVDVAVPEEDDESGFTDEEEEAVDDAPLPPDPSTVKKPSWFNEALPGAATAPAGHKPLSTGGYFNFAKPAESTTPQPTPFKPAAPQARPPIFPSQTNTPEGFPKPSSIFNPPAAKSQESPRSPSPVRSVTTPAGVAGGRGPTLQVPPAKPLTRPSSRLSTSSRPQTPQAQEPEYTPKDLSDDEDTRIRAELERPIQPVLKLDAFVAHNDYAGAVSKPGIPGQIEKVYRDVNSMLDTLGLNARTLENFVTGHAEGMKDGGRERKDLAIEDDDSIREWVLVETDDIPPLLNEMDSNLELGRLDDVHQKLKDLQALDKGVSRLHHRILDLRKSVAAKSDPERKASARREPLDAATASLQRELRDKAAEFSTLLAQAEEAVVLLRAKIASVPQKGRPKEVPTVENVEKTIRKMTAMAQEKSGDVDLLEMKMRKLGMSVSRPTSARPLGVGVEPPLNSSFGTPMGTPRRPTSKGKTFGLSYGDGTEKGVDERDDEEERVKKYAERTRRRRVMAGKLRTGVLEKGPRVTKLRE